MKMQGGYREYPKKPSNPNQKVTENKGRYWKAFMFRPGVYSVLKIIWLLPQEFTIPAIDLR